MNKGKYRAFIRKVECNEAEESRGYTKEAEAWFSKGYLKRWLDFGVTTSLNNYIVSGGVYSHATPPFNLSVCEEGADYWESLLYHVPFSALSRIDQEKLRIILRERLGGH